MPYFPLFVNVRHVIIGGSVGRGRGKTRQNGEAYGEDGDFEEGMF